MNSKTNTILLKIKQAELENKAILIVIDEDSKFKYPIGAKFYEELPKNDSLFWKVKNY